MPTVTRRLFLGALGMPLLVPPARLLEGFVPRGDGEAFWEEVKAGFTVPGDLMNLNNGGVSPAPAAVQESMKRLLDRSNGPAARVILNEMPKEMEAVRTRLARAWDVDPEEVAITRNASESLQICQFGVDLQRGDEVLTTNQDYPRMLNTFRQRERREGIVLKTFSLPVPAEDDDEVVRLFAENITARTKLILVCHMINLTGQILPVRKVVAMARGRGIPVIVDGAHALAHFDFKLSDLDCDYYGTSLHKWLFAPHGTGLLYVRRDKIPGLWPLMAATETQDDDIRKFEEIGTHPGANGLAIADALDFHEAIGGKRKEERLVALRDRWARRLLAHDRVRLHTSLRPGKACGIANVQIDGIDSGDLATWLWDRHRIIVTPIRHEEFEGIRVSPSVYTSFDEIDRFADAMETAVREGLPG